MKKVFLGLCILSFLMICSASYSQVNIDVTGSHVDIQDSTTIRVHNVTSPEAPGSYWIDFQWDAVSLAFVPVNLGQEPTMGKTWTVRYNIASGTATIAITEDLTNRALQLEITVLSGDIGNVCNVPWKVAQGQNNFSGYLNCTGSNSSAGSTISANLNDVVFENGMGTDEPFPQWFDFNSPFGLTVTVNDSATSWVNQTSSWMLK